MRKIFSVLLLAAAAHTAASGASDSLRVLRDALLGDVEFLSDSLCAGRRTGTPGGVEAAAYIMRRFRESGLSCCIQAFETATGTIGHNIVACSGNAFSGIAHSGQQNIREEAALRGNAAKTLYTVVMAYYDGLGRTGDRFYPGADSNASGVAALLALAERLSGRSDVLLVALDGHNANSSGAAALCESLKGQRIRMVVNLDIIGATSSPVDRYWPEYLIALGGEAYARSFERCNSGLGLHLYYDYYRSRSFTDLFYRRTGDHKPFLDRKIPCVVFTSGITLDTNRSTDTFDSLDYAVMAKRVELIARWIGL